MHKNHNTNWFPDGKINLSYNFLDRHMINMGEKVAIYQESIVEGQSKAIKYKELLQDV